MIALSAPKLTAGKMLRRLRRDRSGSAAVEFALVAPLFFCMLFAIIELALMFFATQVLENIAHDSARAILTGQAQSGSVPACAVKGAASPCTQDTFKAYACSRIPALFDCNGLYVDVKSYDSSFASVTLPGRIANGSFDPAGIGYDPGSAGQVVVVRMYYQWPLFVTGLGFNMSNLNGNKRLLVATAAFQNEPY